MPIPAARLDDKINATQFKALAGLVLSVQAHYCNITTKDIPQVELTPVIDFELGTRRVCLDTDVAWDLSNSYSPFHNLATYTIDWGDGTVVGPLAWGGGPSGNYGAAAGEWPDFGTYTITITITDDAGGGVGGPFSTTIEEQIEIVDCSVFPFDGYAGLDGGGVYRATTWTAKNTDLTGDWLTVYDIDINTARTARGEPEVWIATAAGVAVSADGGDHWRKLPLEDPEDTWSVGITAALLNYTMIARDVVNPDKCYIIAEYDSNPGSDEWVGYLLYTDNNFATWTWKALGGTYQTAATWGYTQQIPLFWSAEGDQLDAIVSQQQNVINAIGAPNGQYGGTIRTYTNRTGQAFNDNLYEIIFDLGAYVTTDSGTVSGGINVEMTIGLLTDTMTYVANEPDVQLFSSAGGSDTETLLRWDGPVDGYPPVTPSTLNDNSDADTQPFRHVKIRHISNAYTGSGVCTLLTDGMRIYPHAVWPWIRPMSISVDKLTGRYLYMTICNMRNNKILVWDTQDMTTFINERRIGTLVVPSPTYRQAKVLSPLWRDALVSGYQTLVWGELGGAGDGIALMPAFEYGTPFTQYGYPVTGFEFSNITPGVTSDYDGGAEWPLEDTIYIGKSTTLRITEDGGANWSTLGVTLGANYAQLPQVGDLLSPDWVGELIVGNRDLAAGNAIRVQYTMDNAASWIDLSAGLPATDVRVLRLLSER